MNTKALVVLLVALQCGALLTQAARPLGEEAAHGSLRKVLASASSTTVTSAKSNDEDGFADAGVTTKAFNGNIDAKATADSQAFTKSKNAVAKAISVAISKVKGGRDAAAAAESAAAAVGKAIAAVKVSTFVAIYSDGKKNKGCGSAAANAEAEAKAYTVAIATAFAKAANKKAEAAVLSKAAAIQVAYAKASAETESDVCLYGEGYGKSRQSAYALAFVEVYSEAISDAFAEVGKLFGTIKGGSTAAFNDNKQSAKVGSSNEATIVGEGKATGYTNADADTDVDPFIKQYISFP